MANECVVHVWSFRDDTCVRCGIALREQYEARRAALATGVEPQKPLVFGIARSTEPVRLFVVDFAKLDAVAPKPPATCASCSSSATCNGHCVYCANRLGMGPRPFTEVQVEYRFNTLAFHRENQEAARARMALMDRREAKRPTATDRELAKAHPWPCGGEDEP